MSDGISDMENEVKPRRVTIRLDIDWDCNKSELKEWLDYVLAFRGEIDLSNPLIWYDLSDCDSSYEIEDKP